jgi:phosphopantetheinyl transferase (holo-ACP synthase)
MTDSWIKSEIMDYVSSRKLGANETQIDKATELAEDYFYDRVLCKEVGANYWRLNRADRFLIYDYALQEAIARSWGSER